MAKLTVTFDDIADSEYLGMFFKDEGDFLIVKFHKKTKKPLVGNDFIEFGMAVSTYLTREDMEGINTEEQLKNFMYNQINKQ